MCSFYCSRLINLQVFIFAQIAGAFTGAALVYANYYHAINIFEGGVGVRTLKTAGIFSTYSVRPSQANRLILDLTYPCEA